MTNPSIPPCPMCEKAPTSHSDCVIGNDTCKYCAGVHNDWGRHINHIWFVCINELGIETVEQLMARLAPDPRVAVLEAQNTALKIACENLNIVIDRLEAKLIAAQRGEGI